MELGSAALTGLFIGMAWALVRVVEYFVRKYGKNTERYCLTDDQAKKLEEIHTMFGIYQKYGMLSDGQEKTIENIEKMVKSLYELHCVYDDNHVPRWYVPKEILTSVRAIQKDIDTMHDNLRDEINRIGTGQSVSIEKMSELINSQRLVTERLGDLINIWAKVMKGND